MFMIMRPQPNYRLAPIEGFYLDRETAEYFCRIYGEGYSVIEQSIKLFRESIKPNHTTTNEEPTT